MKLTPTAFEAIYQKCDPGSRKTFFKGLRMYTPPALAVCHIEVPASRIEQMITGYSNLQVKMVAVSEGAWDVAG